MTIISNIPGMGGSMGGAGGRPGQPSPFELRSKTAWPTMFFTRLWRDHPKHTPGLLACFEELRSAQSKNIESEVAVGAKAEQGLFEGRMDLFETCGHPDVKQLARFCASTIRKVVWQVNGREVDAKRIAVEFKDSWYHITIDGGFHDAHYHSGCSWCGIYYVQAGDTPTDKPEGAGNGVSRFYAPVGCGGMIDDYGNKYLGTGMLDVPPRDGMLVIFPAFLLHSGLPYRGSADRVLVAFNTCTTLTDGPTGI